MTLHNYVIGMIVTFVIRFFVSLFGEFENGMSPSDYVIEIAFMAFGSMLWVLTVPCFILGKILYLANNYKWNRLGRKK